MDPLEHCKDIVELDKSILLVALIENANLLGSYFKKPMVPPNEQRFKVLRIQTELMVSMAKNNEDFFGELSYLMFHSKLLDVFLFPVGKSRKLKLLAVAVKRPYDHDQIAKKILGKLSRMKD
ncbi:MAG TPA: hypothetical protein VI338_01385 [Nitrososphaera sp.]|jgi:hypothetical protein|nr:hypothetical protein [Nitrososphaera sp.]